jgi:hypothetical protein
LDADAVTVLAKLSTWFADYNRVHPHSAPQYRSPEMFRGGSKDPSTLSGFIGATTPKSLDSALESGRLS